MGTPARVVVLPKEKAPMRIEEINLPDPGPSQVVVKQFASGICHSQLHQIHKPRKGPVVLGHESTGIILKAGSDVTHVAEGDTVLITWIPRNAATADGPPVWATLEVSEGLAQSENVFTWADHTIADQQFVVKVDPGIKTDVTAIVGCAVMTGAGAVIRTAGVQAGQSVAILGVGGVGLSAIAGARMAGANPIIAVDLDDEKLEFARKFGATHTLNATNLDPVAAIRELTAQEGRYSLGGRLVCGADFVFDCIGIAKTMEQSVAACRTGRLGVECGGTAVLVGLPTTTLELKAFHMLINEKKFIGSMGGSCVPEKDLPVFLQWYEQGDLDLDALITARYSIEQINEAATALDEGTIKGRAILEFDCPS